MSGAKKLGIRISTKLPKLSLVVEFKRTIVENDPVILRLMQGQPLFAAYSRQILVAFA